MVWTGAQHGKPMRYMLQPVLQTLAAGLAATATNHSRLEWGVGKRPTDVQEGTRHLSRGDIFIWVGRYGLARGQGYDYSPRSSLSALLQGLTRRGVHTVFYNADPGDGCWTHRLPVSELWDYSWSTAAESTPPECLRRLPIRHVPPGFVRRRPRANLTSSSRQLLFMGVTDASHAQRRFCLEQLNHQLQALSLSVVSDNSVWTDDAFAATLRVYGLFLNVHKLCNVSTPPNADCETFRFAQVLSAGGLVISERCPEARDEEEWRGLVEFSPLDKIPQFAHRLVEGGPVHMHNLAAGRLARFASRFDPVAIFERASLPQLFAMLSSRRRGIVRCSTCSE